MWSQLQLIAPKSLLSGCPYSYSSSALSPIMVGQAGEEGRSLQQQRAFRIPQIQSDCEVKSEQIPVLRAFCENDGSSRYIFKSKGINIVRRKQT